MQNIPKDRKHGNGYIILAPTEAAKAIKAQRGTKPKSLCKTSEQVRKEEENTAKKDERPNPDRFYLLGYHELQVGQYQEQTFHWLAENDISYAAYLVNQVELEGGNTGDNPMNHKKHQLKVNIVSLFCDIYNLCINSFHNASYFHFTQAYLQGFPDGRLAIKQKGARCKRRRTWRCPKRRRSRLHHCWLVPSAPMQLFRSYRSPRLQLL
ncbi:hypothetical protein DPMN_130547 [Dreissena polymorpha]|uniref:Uncharacterized protein n=1 Tax=Dreissena polymorpha TaxID=45954 RepID=A0A9D4H7S9_DREPO|nr:hypothetical protein DPMN_130547 [Dreissena polymorpha]